VGQKLKELVEKRKDCVAFLSCPISNAALSNTDKLEISKKYRNQIGSSSYVFIDSGYKYTYDIYNDKYRWVPLNGDIAGLCARTDSTNDPWYSPAGFNRGNVKGVVKLAFNPTQTFRDELYKNNINPVVTFPGEGTVLYGDKTAQTKPSAFDRINVRRLFIVLEKAIATASKYSLFEFNDAFTRAQFVSLVDPFLREVQSRRGIIDFKVVCNERNNTPEVIDSNRFVADIYIKPTRSINFIQLNFVATRTGVSFNEVGA
jgi:phage tail sheath protein FI